MNEPTTEDVRRFWDARPCNVRHSSLPVGTREYFDEIATRKRRVEPHVPGFAQFERWRGRRVLEVGCGIGTDAADFARAGADYVGVDLSGESLALARRRFEVLGLRGRFVQADAERLGEALAGERPFDLVWSFGVLHHTPDPLRALAQIRRRIDPEGELRIMVYARHSWKSVMIEAGLDQRLAQAGCPIADTYTRDELARMLVFSGFAPTKIEQAHVFPYRVESYVRGGYELEPWFAAMPPAVFAAMERGLGWHLLCAAKPI